MGRHVKDGRYINVNISSEAFEALERHCAESGQTKTVAVERAVLACYGGKRPTGGPMSGRTERHGSA